MFQRRLLWRSSTLIHVFKNKSDVLQCNNYRGIKLMCHTTKLYERVLEQRIRNCVNISDEQFGFMPGRSTTDAIFILKQLQEKYREGQKPLHCVFIALEKAYDRVPREELLYCMREKKVPEKYVRVREDIYWGSSTIVKCAAGDSQPFEVKVKLHQG